MDLASYLARIGVERPQSANLAALRELNRAHLHAMPFENLDVQLRRPVTLAIEPAFDKLVTRRRGGWCYEQNGLFGWALRELGFDVTRVAAGVMRERAGDPVVGNHLCLLVRLGDKLWLVDVGFGASLAEPLELEAIERNDAPYRITLSQVDGWWRFSERTSTSEETFNFDFRAEPASEPLMEGHCLLQQTEADSSFVQNLVVQRRIGEVHYALRGKVLTELRRDGEKKRTLASPAELVGELRETFGLDVPEVADLWPQICARHEVVFR